MTSAKIIKIGNSAGIRIPLYIMRDMDLHIGDNVNITYTSSSITLSTSSIPRHNWEKQFRDDAMLNPTDNDE